MARPSPEQYQLAFAFHQRNERPTQPYPVQLAASTPIEARESSLGRFVHALNNPLPVHNPIDAATFLTEWVYHPFRQVDQEEMWSLLLDRRNHLTHAAMVYRGDVGSIAVRPAEVFKEAVRLNAPGLILSHVHPSGNPEPSHQDVRLTHLLREAGTLLGIELLDHIVVGRHEWVSLRAKHLGFE